VVELSLAELLIERGDEASRSEAHALLDALQERNRPDWMFNASQFRWLVACSALAARNGARERQAEAARSALSLVGAEPQFPRHPTIGLVEPDPQTLAWLRKAATGRMSEHKVATPPWKPSRSRRRWWRKGKRPA
jgi:hypothetical protein